MTSVDILGGNQIRNRSHTILTYLWKEEDRYEILGCAHLYFPILLSFHSLPFNFHHRFYHPKIGVFSSPYVAQWQITDEKLSWKSPHVAPKGLKLIIVHCDLISQWVGSLCRYQYVSKGTGNTLKFGLLIIILRL